MNHRSLLLLLPLLGLAAPAVAAKPEPPADTTRQAEAAGLVFALRTGLEDTLTLTSAFRHAKTAKESGHLANVTVVVYGRAIVAFDPDVALPADMKAAMDEARAAGVRIVACETALSKYGISKEAALAHGETVPNGMSEIARLVAAGHEVLSY